MIAFFVDGDGQLAHAARQLQSGRWTSKLGDLEDIEHDLRALEDQPNTPSQWPYGRVSAFMRRRA
jgi:hypothetical protein